MASGMWLAPHLSYRDQGPDAPPLPAQYYRRHAARVRQLASQATTAPIRDHLRDVALQYERLAEHVEASTRAGEEAGGKNDRDRNR